MTFPGMSWLVLIPKLISLPFCAQTLMVMGWPAGFLDGAERLLQETEGLDRPRSALPASFFLAMALRMSPLSGERPCVPRFHSVRAPTPASQSAHCARLLANRSPG